MSCKCWVSQWNGLMMMFTRTRYTKYNIFCECLHSLWPGFCSFCVLSLAIWEVAFHCQEVFIQSKFQSCAHIWRKWNLRPCHSNELLPGRPHAWTLNAENAWNESLPQCELQSPHFHYLLAVDIHQCSHLKMGFEEVRNPYKTTNIM